MSAITNEDVLKVDYFHDFLEFVKYLQEKPILRTATGNISRAEIEALSKVFHQGEKLIYIEKEFGWKVLSEMDCPYLHQIRITAEVMYLIYKRRNEFRLSRNGKGYLTNIEPFIQYRGMVLCFFNRVNWEYFDPDKITKVLQQNQIFIWQNLLRAGNEWLEFKPFCQALKISLNLDRFFEPKDHDIDFMVNLNIRYGLLKHLILFGCIETETKKEENSRTEELVRFRPTPLGLYIFEEALKPF